VQVKAYQGEQPEQQPAQQPEQIGPKDLIILQKNMELMLKDMEMRSNAATSELKQELKQELSELKQDLSAVKQELKQDLSELKQDLSAVKQELKQDLWQVKWSLAALVVIAVVLGLKELLPFLKLVPFG
jgi:Sec-independent protein translocase protein TatA